MFYVLINRTTAKCWQPKPFFFRAMMRFYAHPLEIATKLILHKTLFFNNSSVALNYRELYIKKSAVLLKVYSAENNQKPIKTS